MADVTFDEFGRGPLQREFHRRCGYDARQHLGFAAFARQVRIADRSGSEFPEMFRGMMERAIREMVAPLIEEERQHTLAMAEAMVLAVVDDKLEPVRNAFARLREDMKRRPAIAGR